MTSSVNAPAQRVGAGPGSTCFATAAAETEGGTSAARAQFVPGVRSRSDARVRAQIPPGSPLSATAATGEGAFNAPPRIFSESESTPDILWMSIGQYNILLFYHVKPEPD